jgi:outer membrane protein, heavy metal efflux system
LTPTADAPPGRRRTSHARRSLAAGVVLLSLTGCVHYQPRPIAPEPALAALEARTLDSPDLALFLKSQPEPIEWPPAAWDLRALTLAAFYYQPDLDVARSNWAAARAGAIRAGERPNPNLNFEPGYNSTTPAGQMTPWILTLALDFTVETAGKRGHRIAAAHQLSEAARLDVAVAAWQVRSRVRKALLDLHGATGTVALLGRQIDVQQANVGLLERQLAAGAISPFELTQARLAFDGMRLGLDDARRRRAESYVQLAGALGVTARALDGLTLGFGTFEQPPADLPAPSVRRQALLNRPDLLGALAAYEATQADLQLEIARQYPDLHLGPGYQMDQADNKWTLGLPVALPLFNRNRGAIAEAEARRAEAAARFTALQNRAIEETDVSLAGYDAARAKMTTAEAMLADLRKQELASRARWRAGEISKLDLGSLQLELISLERARFEALVQAHEALGRLEDAMQSPADLPAWLLTTPRAATPAAGHDQGDADR